MVDDLRQIAQAQKDDYQQAVVLITDSDITGSREDEKGVLRRLNYLYGRTWLVDRVVVMSIYRFYSPDIALQQKRILKTDIPELGHAFGLADCATPGCVMRFFEDFRDSVDGESRN